MHRHPFRLLLAAAFTVLLHPAPTPAAACVGDFDADTRVQVDEILQLVHCALTGAADETCSPTDVTDIQLAVINALEGCGVQPTWVSHPLGRQCEGDGIDDLVTELGRLLNGVTVHASCVNPVTILCCGCPIVVMTALVAERDVQRLLSEGWQRALAGCF